jgi:class 3 adenylate cyclase/streptogramin lyase
VNELPSGTVSLLFTDIEGSTQLQHRLGDSYRVVVNDHRRLLEDVIAAHGGRVVDRQTESFFAVFSRMRDAAAAAADAQRGLAAQEWPEGAEVKVRMGIHAGEPELEGDRYVGLAVARAARVAATAHGGQVLLSGAARGLLPERSRVRHLGSYPLKDFESPEPLFQLEVDGLPAQFPPLRTGTVRRRRRLPIFAAAAAALVVAAFALVLLSGRSESIAMGETSVGVVDPASNELVDEIPLGFKSSLIAAGEGFVWVADPGGSTLAKIDPESREVVARFGVETGATPFGLAAGLGAVWLAVQRGETYEVLELGPEFGDLRGRIPFGEPADPVPPGLRGLALGEGGVWVVEPAVGGLWRVDPQRSRAMKVADGLNVSSLAVGGGAVWAGGSVGVTRIDAATGETIAEAQLVVSQPGETSAVALGDDALWFVTSSTAQLFRLHPETGNALGTVAVGPGPAGISIAGADVWVVSSQDGTASRVAADRQASVVELGTLPGGVATGFEHVWISAGEARG